MGSNTYFVKTAVGKFKVTYKKDDPFEYLQMGGKNFCVMLRWLSRAEDVELQWLDTYGMHCEMSGIQIRKEKTIHLFHLSIMILKHYNAGAKRLTLLDNSKFPCNLPDGTTKMPSLKHFYFLFHQKTWYEAKFKAYPSFNTEQYESIKTNFSNPSIKKPFYFMNDDLETMLQPIYKESNTWAEFLEKVAKIPNYCSKVYPWYTHAVSAILEAKTMIPDNWIIDITPDLFPEVVYETIKVGGGKRWTRKIQRFQPELFSIPDTPEMSKMAELRFR